jgi:hypothetical protein
MKAEIQEIFDEMKERMRLSDKRAKAGIKRTVKHKRKRPVKPSLISQQPHLLPFHLRDKEPETFSKAIDCKKGKSLSEIHRCRISKSLRASYKVVSPDSKVQIISNLKQHCLKNDLNYKCMLDVARQRLKQHKGGWLCFKLENNENC